MSQNHHKPRRFSRAHAPVLNKTFLLPAFISRYQLLSVVKKAFRRGLFTCVHLCASVVHFQPLVAAPLPQVHRCVSVGRVFSSFLRLLRLFAAQSVESVKSVVPLSFALAVSLKSET
jgi:hypothetical protein